MSLHGFFDELTHGRKLHRCRWPVEGATHRLLANIVLTNERSEIHRYILLFDITKDGSDIQRGSATISGDDGSDAHADKIFRFRHFCDFIGVGVNINESRCDDETLGVYFGFGVTLDAADCGDRVVLLLGILAHQPVGGCALADRSPRGCRHEAVDFVFFGELPEQPQGVRA